MDQGEQPEPPVCRLSPSTTPLPEAEADLREERMTKHLGPKAQSPEKPHVPIRRQGRPIQWSMNASTLNLIPERKQGHGALESI